MAKKKRTVLECDNPDCSNYVVDWDNGEPIPGYHLGKGYWDNGGGGPIPATYACSIECIGPAVQANINSTN